MNNIEEMRKEVATFSDKLGQKVDPKIFDLVVALRLHGFNTVFSCQGHVERKSSFYPHVDITITDKETHTEKYKANIISLSKLINLLTEFYQKQPIDYKNMLICISSWGTSGFIELRPNSGLSSVYEIRNLEERKKLHKQYLKECNDFTKFLMLQIS
ncbi:MAG: hypothetical protein GY793_04285 [Proteobacteria bacterium]|nr:hypothetical protein [Pseudomonadota bacterium]